MAKQQTQPQNAPGTAEKPKEQQHGNGHPKEQQPQQRILPPLPIEKEITYVPFQEAEPITLTIAGTRRLYTKPTKNGFQCSDEDCLLFMLLCRARALNPAVGDAYLVGYDTRDGPVFNLITAFQALLKRAEFHPHYAGKESGIVIRIGKEDKDILGEIVPEGAMLMGAWSKAYRKDREWVDYARINLRGYNKGHGRWNDDAPGMIVKCAEAKALRSAFPLTLGGMIVRGEQNEEQEEINATTGNEKTADRVADKLKGTTEKIKAAQAITGRTESNAGRTESNQMPIPSEPKEMEKVEVQQQETEQLAKQEQELQRPDDHRDIEDDAGPIPESVQGASMSDWAGSGLPK